MKDSDLLTNGRVKLFTSNGWLGYPSAAPFDVIHVGAGAASIPHELLKQLNVSSMFNLCPSIVYNIN